MALIYRDFFFDVEKVMFARCKEDFEKINTQTMFYREVFCSINQGKGIMHLTQTVSLNKMTNCDNSSLENDIWAWNTY